MPKILLVVALGAMTPDRHSLAEGVDGLVTFFTSREPGDLALLAGLIGAWLGLLLLARWVYQVMRRRDAGL